MKTRRLDFLGYPNYEIYTDGRIYSLHREKFLTPGKNIHGYLYVNICPPKKYWLLHRLVALAFIDNAICEKTIINHIDGNKENNNVDNLEWCTYSENNKHALSTGLRKMPSGINHASSKVSDTQVLTARTLLSVDYCRSSICNRLNIPRYVLSHLIIKGSYPGFPRVDPLELKQLKSKNKEFAMESRYKNKYKEMILELNSKE
jgi:hypothetical protein